MDGTTASCIPLTGWGWDDTGSGIAVGQAAGSTTAPGIAGVVVLAIGAGGPWSWLRFEIVPPPRPR